MSESTLDDIVVKVFSCRVIGEAHVEDAGFDHYHHRRLVTEAYDEGYGLVERIKKLTHRNHPLYPGSDDFVEVEFRALGVKLHG